MIVLTTYFKIFGFENLCVTQALCKFAIKPVWHTSPKLSKFWNNLLIPDIREIFLFFIKQPGISSQYCSQNMEPRNFFMSK